MKLTYDDFISDPELRARILRDARRERARAIAGFALSLKDLFSRPRYARVPRRSVFG